jgi:hypothetical protein
VHGVVGEAINIIGGVSCLTLIPHRVGVAWVDVCAIINVDVEIFVLSIVTIVSHEWHDKVASSRSAGTAVSCLHVLVHLVRPIVRLHLLLVVGWAPNGCGLEHLIKPTNRESDHENTHLFA